MILKIPYKKFLRNRYDVYDLIKRGYKFAIVVENDNNIDNSNLNMFKYVLVNEKHPKLEKYANKLKNIVIINN